MNFIHQDDNFVDLLRIVASATGIDPSLVEKDYWVVHSLWALHQGPFEVWFKGGTSLSKGFGLIQRFSEDLDLKVVPTDSSAFPPANWTVKKPSDAQREQRKAWFRQLSREFAVPGAVVRVNEEHWLGEPRARDADIHVVYPGHHLAGLGSHNSPYIKLEIGNARVTPFVVRPVSSFVHDYLEGQDLLREYVLNRPAAVQHVHPWVTLLEKLSIVTKRYGKPEVQAERFVRHYEDAARICTTSLDPPEGYTLKSLADEMISAGTLGSLPCADDPALALVDPVRRVQLQGAYDALQDMYWGPRQTLEEACAVLRDWATKAALA